MSSNFSPTTDTHDRDWSSFRYGQPYTYENSRVMNDLDTYNDEGAEPERTDAEYDNDQKGKPSHSKIEEKKGKDGIIPAEFNNTFHGYHSEYRGQRPENRLINANRKS